MVPLLLQTCGTSFRPVRQVSDLWDKNLSSCIKINDKSMFTEKMRCIQVLWEIMTTRLNMLDKDSKYKKLDCVTSDYENDLMTT